MPPSVKCFVKGQGHAEGLTSSHNQFRFRFIVHMTGTCSVVQEFVGVVFVRLSVHAQFHIHNIKVVQ